MISMTDRRKKGLRAAAIYAGMVLLTALFGVIYTHFGHGVKSVFMSYAFLFPSGGALLYGLLAFAEKIPYPTRNASRCAAYSLTAFTLDFLLQGILDIAGAFSDAKIAMTVMAYGFAFAAVAIYCDRLETDKKTTDKTIQE